MQIVLVDTPALSTHWVQMAPSLYKGDNQYIRPLDAEIAMVFDPKQNERFASGAAERWLLKDANGRWVGRIAAFYQNSELNPGPDADQPHIKLGSMGFFECIDNKEAAGVLLQTAEEWLKSKGANVVQGPVNFGERDKWWGLLVDGFIEPTYGMPYHQPYYRALLEGHGYQDYFKQYTYYTPVARPLGPLIAAKAKRVSQDPGYSFRNISRAEIMPFAEPFRQMYNRAWGDHSGVVQMTEESAQKLVADLKPVMDERIIWFGFYNGTPISFFIMLPDVNQIFKYFDGKMGIWEKIKFYYLFKRKTIKRIIGIVYGVVPEHQGKGIETAMTYEAAKVIQDPKLVHYTDFEMNWIGDFNPRMMKVAELMGGVILKTHITYRKMLDTTIPFERCKPIT